MLIIFSIVSLLSLASFVFFIYLLYQKTPQTLGSWKLILIITLYSITSISSVYYVVTQHIKSSTDYRPFITILTVLIAFISFTTSVFLTNRTTDINKENQKKSFIMDLIKNNSSILKEKESSIDSLIRQLDIQFKSPGYSINHITPLLSEHLYNQRTRLQPSLDLIQTKGTFKKDNGFLLGAFEQDLDSVSRVLVTSLLMHSSYKPFYDQLDDSITDKILSTNFQKVLSEERILLDNIHQFIQRKEIQDILKKDVSTLSYSELKPLIEKQFDENYKHLGHFFRNSYRVVKTINNFSEGDAEFKKTFLGILRSYYSENVLVAIYYNSVFTDKGLGYANELALSDFFGDELDLSKDTPIHFRKESLYFDQKDLRTIKKIFTSESAISSKIRQQNQKLAQTIQEAFDHS